MIKAESECFHNMKLKTIEDFKEDIGGIVGSCGIEALPVLEQREGNLIILSFLVNEGEGYVEEVLIGINVRQKALQTSIPLLIGKR